MSELVSHLVMNSGLSRGDVLGILRNAPKRYKHYKIDKRSGGEREISQPSPELKMLQRAFVTTHLQHLPVHESATAYVQGAGIKKNASIHASNGPILKMDFSGFFPSITERDWRAYCGERKVFNSEGDLELSVRLLFMQKPRSSVKRLSIGAPSSPALSNVLMYDFDSQVSNFVSKDYVTYTRYADDLTFSAERTGYLVNVIKGVKKIIKDIKYPRLAINENKTVYATKKYKRMVTGLIINNEGKISIGRERKRKIRTEIDHFRSGLLSKAEIQKLSGHLAFVNDVEPDFISRMVSRYGLDVIQSIKYHSSD